MSALRRASAPLLRARFNLATAKQRQPTDVSPRTELSEGITRISAPGFSAAIDAGHVHHNVEPDSVTLCIGSPQVAGATNANPAHSIAPLMRQGSIDLGSVRGRYLLVHFDLAGARLIAATDRFGVYPLCYAHTATGILLSDRADSAFDSELPEIDAQAVFDYVYFHVIPAPRTIFRGVRRLPAARMLIADKQGSRIVTTWRPSFTANGAAPLDDLKAEFRGLVEQAVSREVTTPRIGSFLSGGTDSSTVLGMLERVLKRPPATFSIGFDAAGYVEMGYARIAARHFGAEQHEYYVTPGDLLGSIPRVAGHYDQPFGNSSAVAAFHCAQLAQERGIEKMLAGDGGDELFGGNSRYAKQKTFEAYYRIPAGLRRNYLEPVLLGWPAIRRMPLIKKAASYVEQARMPMPERMETYNLLGRFGPINVFTPSFLESVDHTQPLRLQRSVYQDTDATSLVDQMLAYDWRFTLADNDLPKVTGSTRLAGELVGFPMLDDDLVDFSLRLAPEMKVKGLTLRFFFKEALRGFLPNQIIRKRKHGFGMPFGPWLTRDPQLRSLASTSIESLADRRIIRRELASELLAARIAEHAGYYGELVWVLMMLEQWLQARAPGYSIR